MYLKQLVLCRINLDNLNVQNQKKKEVSEVYSSLTHNQNQEFLDFTTKKKKCVVH